MNNIIDTLGALWVLVTFAICSRLNFKSSYWNWRINTAFPSSDAPASQPANQPANQPGKHRLALEYARWAYRIRRLR